MSWFEGLTVFPPDPVLGLIEEFDADPRKEKLSLTVGAYRDEHLRPVIFHATKKAEELLLAQEKDKEYLPMAGDVIFLDSIGKLAFGEKNWKEYHSHITSIQTVGGTGALRIGGEFLKPLVANKLYISSPSWPNHRHLLQEGGYTIETYPYYDGQNHKVDFQKLIEFCETLPPNVVFLLHLSCHNPTGCDLTHEQWKLLSKMMLKKRIFPFFDCAYQGLGKGLAQDTDALQIFIQDGHEFIVAYSCSKNFSLYCERVGALFVFSRNKDLCPNILNVLKMKTRGIISTPPAHGARIVSFILNTPDLYEAWKQELELDVQRILAMRHKLSLVLGKGYAFIQSGKGLFCITGLQPNQIERLKREWGIYMTLDGRINIAGLNEEAVDLLAYAIKKVVI